MPFGVSQGMRVYVADVGVEEGLGKCQSVDLLKRLDITSACKAYSIFTTEKLY